MAITSLWKANRGKKEIATTTKGGEEKEWPDIHGSIPS